MEAILALRLRNSRLGRRARVFGRAVDDVTAEGLVPGGFVEKTVMVSRLLAAWLADWVGDCDAEPGAARMQTSRSVEARKAAAAHS
jgi:hypothetical protein